MEKNDEINESLGKLFQWQVDHQGHDTQAFNEINARFDSVESNMSMLPTKQEIDKIVTESLINFFTTKGILSKNILITIALVIGSITVIAGGAKWILGIIGFSYLSK